MNIPKHIDFIAYVAEFTFESYFDKYMFVKQHGRDRAQIKQKLADAYNYFQKQQNEIPPPPHHHHNKKIKYAQTHIYKNTQNSG